MKPSRTVTVSVTISLVSDLPMSFMQSMASAINHVSCWVALKSSSVCSTRAIKSSSVMVCALVIPYKGWWRFSFLSDSGIAMQRLDKLKVISAF